jgi:hypothetical protein
MEHPWGIIFFELLFIPESSGVSMNIVRDSQRAVSWSDEVVDFTMQDTATINLSFGFGTIKEIIHHSPDYSRLRLSLLTPPQSMAKWCFVNL